MITSTRLLVFLALLSSAAATLARAEDCGETVLYNGKIATMDQRDTMASSITIRGDRIVAVGTSPGIPKRDGCATLIDLKGRRAIPGLIDQGAIVSGPTLIALLYLLTTREPHARAPRPG